MESPKEQASAPVTWIIVLSLIAFATAAWWWLQKPAYVSVPLTAAPANNRIVLTLADGQIVNLSDSTHASLETNDATLYFTQHGISYTPKILASTGWNTLYIPEGKTYLLLLHDSTRITLNSKTTLRFKFTSPGKSRQLYLDGEAYFKVPPVDQQPFIVHTPVTDITADAATFDVNTYDREHVRTTLISGSLNTTDQRTNVTLEPGMEAIYNADADFSVHPVNVHEIISWTEKATFSNRHAQKLSTLAPCLYHHHSSLLFMLSSF
ncbi:FecR family protein [Chitinophaga vietnamensis]|uniref:FecR family protein n=1 Tax=Chitinophaga vietnamensis TaxID=2593957 RepID=UPI00117778FA|nr:FecR family protein [Chitinophaga vietnamensis]